MEKANRDRLKVLFAGLEPELNKIRLQSQEILREIYSVDEELSQIVRKLLSNGIENLL